MNYRHEFHAGNFADVLKHAILARVIGYLLQKQTPFRYIDTHAGVGVYDLESVNAVRTLEWEKGIARVYNHDFNPENTAFLAPYRASIAALNTNHSLRYYPGSPEIMRSMARPNDRLVLCELHKEDAAHLRWRYARDERVKVCELDGWTGLNAFIPPKERRGIVLIDPPFEQPNEFERIHQGLTSAYKKWETGLYMLWYPIKHRADTDVFIQGMKNQDIPKMLHAELYIREPNTSNQLNGTGILIINPPWLLEQELRALLPELCVALHNGTQGGWKVENIGTQSQT